MSGSIARLDLYSDVQPPKRRRVGRLDGATSASLDFSPGPGSVSIGGQQECTSDWASRPRPMAALIDAFLAAARGGVGDPRPDASVALRAAELIGQVAPVYNLRRLQWPCAALAGGVHDDADPAYALAEAFLAHIAMSAEVLEAHARHVREQFRSSGDTGWLAALTVAADPVAMLDMTAA